MRSDDGVDRTSPEFQRRVDALMANVSGMIDQYGWFMTAVGPDPEDEVPTYWCYTTGLIEQNHPEFVVFGLRPEVAHALVTSLYEQIKAGRVFEDGEEITDIANLPVRLRSAPSDDARRPLGTGRRLYGVETFPVLQVVLSDPDGLWPWDPGVDPFMRATQQILLPESIPS